MLKILEGTYDDWKQWFVENRASKFEVFSASPVEITPDTVLLRIFAPPDGRVPKDGYHLTGPTWDIREQKPKDYLILLYEKGQPPLILAIPDHTELIENCATKKQSIQKLSPPYSWRCKVCKTTGESEVLQECCGIRVRQLAPISDYARKWVADFAISASFQFIPVSKISDMPNISQNKDALKNALNAGMELEQILRNQNFECPDSFEVYDKKTHHIRVSDLKNKKDFLKALSSVVKHRGKKIPPKKNANFANLIELGHVFDEIFNSIFSKNKTKNWSIGERVHFNCEQLGLSITGSPDLKYSGVPVEMKTTNILPTKEMDKKTKKGFRRKWVQNYLPQIAMYSHASSIDWMYLLLISRQTGDFTILPVDGREEIEKLQKKWDKWSREKSIRKLLAKYSN